MTSSGRTPTTPRDRFPALNQRAGGPDEAVPPEAAQPATGRRAGKPAAATEAAAKASGAAKAGQAGGRARTGKASAPLARQATGAGVEEADDLEEAGTGRLLAGDDTGRLLARDSEPVLGREAAERSETTDPGAEDSLDDGGEPAGERADHLGDRSGSPDRAHARELFARLVELPEGDAERAAIRDQLVRMHLPLVEYLARRFRNRGEPLDDLVQVATIGLIKSVDRFDPDRGVEFSTYATPTIVGEIKRHFRDKGWAIRVPRRLQELKLSLTKATSELSQSLGRSPTVAEMAAHLKMSEEEVLEGLESANAYSAVSLDAPDSGDDEAPAVADTLGVQDESLEGVEYRESLKPLLEKLPPREKRILLLRFFGNMTQSQIATELGISQMHVSRLLARTLAQLRRGLLEDG
jgi:RNA polymerase sigma-B factor